MATFSTGIDSESFQVLSLVATSNPEIPFILNVFSLCAIMREKNKQNYLKFLGCKYFPANLSYDLLFQFRKDEVQEEDDIPYKYGFFHLVFSLGAMYFAMLFINWDINSSTRK